MTTAVKTALFPGTFDPFTNGHLDLAERAAQLFPRVVVAISQSPRKGTLFSLEERVALAAGVLRSLPNVEVRGFEGLVVDCAREVGAQVMCRGIRAVADFEFEFQMTAMNQQLDRDIETVFLMADPRHQAIASKLVKEIAQLGGDVAPFVSDSIKDRLLAKVGRD